MEHKEEIVRINIGRPIWSLKRVTTADLSHDTAEIRRIMVHQSPIVSSKGHLAHTIILPKFMDIL